MNKLITILGAAVLLTVLVLYMCSFQVRFTEVAVVKHFGEFTDKDIKTEPGLYFKWPWPIESKVVTDKRIRILEDTTEETQTQDKINVLVTTFTCWKVADIRQFHIASSSETNAENKLRELVRSKKKNVVARYNLANFVSTDEQEFKFDEIEQDILHQIQPVALAEYGIAVTDTGIRKLTFPDTVSEQVLERMKKNEESKASKYKKEGEAEAREIRARASAISNNILAVADRLGQQIESQANQEVAQYYKQFDENVELRLFLDRLETSRQVLKERTTLVLSNVLAPFGLDLGSE